MSMTIEQLIAEAMSLPSEDRAILADRVVESLEDVPEAAFDAVWASESQRRLQEV